MRTKPTGKQRGGGKPSAGAPSTPRRPSPASPASPAPRTEGQRLLMAVPNSLGEIAVRLGVAKQSVHGWRTGRKSPAPGARLKLRDLYGVPAESWDLAPTTGTTTPAAASPSAPPVRPRPPSRTGTLGEVEDLLDNIRAERATPGMLASERARLSDSEAKLLTLKARLERERELVEDRIVREHPKWRRIKEAMFAVLKPHPEIARAIAKAIEDLQL